MDQLDIDFLSLIILLSDYSKNKNVEPYKRTIINILTGNIKSSNALKFSDLEFYGKYKNVNSSTFDLLVSKHSRYIRIDISRKHQRFFSNHVLDDLSEENRESMNNQLQFMGEDKNIKLNQVTDVQPPKKKPIEILYMIRGLLIFISILFFFVSMLVTWETGNYGSSGNRVGAVCNDGTRSSSTGSGTCSWHGGVNYWIYSGGTQSTYEEHRLIEYTWPYQCILLVTIIGIYFYINKFEEYKP